VTRRGPKRSAKLGIVDTALEAAVANVLEGDLRRIRQRWYHTYRSTRSPSGFPDYVLPVGRWLIFAELKAAGGSPTAEQAWWLLALRGQDRLSLLVGGMTGAMRLVQLIEGMQNGRRVNPAAVKVVGVLGDISPAGRVLVAGHDRPAAAGTAADDSPRRSPPGRCRRRPPPGS